MRLRCVFMGTPEFAVPTLEMLLADHDVLAVYTQPDRPAGRGRKTAISPVKALAEASGISVRQPRSLRKEPEAVQALAQLEVDAVVVAAYGLILPSGALRAARLGCVNVHASLLPRWRGAAPVHRAILAGDERTGATIMLMDEGLDTGPVLAQADLEIGAQETTGELTPRLAALGAALLAETLPRLATGAIQPRPQDEARATLAPRVAPEEGLLDWREPAAALARRVRAMNPWPGAYTHLPDGKRLKVHAACAAAAGPAPGPEGTLVEADGWPVVATRDGGLRLDVVQLEGRSAMPGCDFLRGRSDLRGRALGEHGDPAA